jgi:hypothetical protein
MKRLSPEGATAHATRRAGKRGRHRKRRARETGLWNRLIDPRKGEELEEKESKGKELEEKERR